MLMTSESDLEVSLENYFRERLDEVCVQLEAAP